MATFVLVHGAFHGGWCWKKVRPVLQRAGHEIFTPTLTGLGERAHLLHAQIGLWVHIQDILGVIVYEDLHEVILVGHSYGGMVITGVADLVPERIRHLVYLDAFLAENGQALCQQFRPEVWAEIQGRIERAGDGWCWSLPDIEKELRLWGVMDEQDCRWMGERLGAQSIKTATEALSLQQPEMLATLPHSFIYCTAKRSSQGTYHQSEHKARTTPGWHYYELPTGHSAMITLPDALAALLLKIAETL